MNSDSRIKDGDKGTEDLRSEDLKETLEPRIRILL